jgi:hypothetical protein
LSEVITANQTAFRPSGCLRRSCWICGPWYDTVISGYACGRGYKMRCSR